MSRGPGGLQRSILDDLSQQPSGRLLWRSLRKRYPREVKQKSFYRAIRSLRRMGRILDYEVNFGYRLGARFRYIALVPVYEVGGRYHFAYEADRELAALADEAQRQLRAVAAARGIRLEPSPTEPLEGTGVDTYRRGAL